jgi:hypothetical protein
MRARGWARGTRSTLSRYTHETIARTKRLRLERVLLFEATNSWQPHIERDSPFLEGLSRSPFLLTHLWCNLKPHALCELVNAIV